jgi:hypothetical protein
LEAKDMIRKWLRKGTIITVAVAVATLAFSGIAVAASGTLDLGPPWGGADQDSANPNRVEVTYEIKASGSVPTEAVAAVQTGIDAWNSAIDGREAGWDFDLLPYGSGGLNSLSGSPPYASHKPGHNPPGKGNGNGDEPDITVQIKKGGGRIAGSAQRTMDSNGFVVKVKIQISGSAFGLQNDPITITEVTMHELGHALGLGHHSNEADLMGRTVGYEGGGPSACDLDGFVKVHEWLTDGDASTGPYIVGDTSIAWP